MQRVGIRPTLFLQPSKSRCEKNPWAAATALPQKFSTTLVPFPSLRPVSISSTRYLPAPSFYSSHFLPSSPSAITTSSAFHFCITGIRPLLMVNAGPTHTMKKAEVGKKGRQEISNQPAGFYFKLLANQGNGVKRLIHHAVWYLAFLCFEVKSFLFLPFFFFGK